MRDGRPVGWYDKSSKYWKVRIKGRSWLLHRVVFYLHNGYLPEIVDHIDQDKNNNHPDNLRDASYKGNNTVNSPIRLDNTSGFRGVTWHKATGKWMSSVFYKGRRYHLGVYDDITVAASKYNAKAKELFGDFAVLNNVGEQNG